MINAHEEAGRILMLVKQLKEGSADEELQMQMIEKALIRAHMDCEKNVELLCEIYFTIAADCIGEDEVRKRRDSMLNQIGEQP